VVPHLNSLGEQTLNLVLQTLFKVNFLIVQLSSSLSASIVVLFGYLCWLRPEPATSVAGTFIGKMFVWLHLWLALRIMTLLEAGAAY
jgi:hypothetical protein